MKKIINSFFLLLSLITLQAQDSTQSKTVHPVILKFGINETIVDLYPSNEFFPIDGNQFHMFFTECNIPLNSFLAICPRVFGSFRIDRVESAR
ncbi:MAG TPA: hypothetical protein VK212_00455 [Lentimicrobium sp.]|nr:hypothetical protein [Lentimicrobium sp.]